MLVTVCVITYQLPKSLQRLMQGLNDLTFIPIAPPEIPVVVVDTQSSCNADVIHSPVLPFGVTSEEYHTVHGS